MKQAAEASLQYSEQAQISALIISDDALFREGLHLILYGEDGITVSDALDYGDLAVAAIEKNRPDVVLLDLPSSVDMAFTQLAQLSRLAGDRRIIALGRNDEIMFAEEMLRRGASGYLLKYVPRRLFVLAVRMISEMPDPMVMILSQHTSRPRGRMKELLSARECEVMDLVAQAHTNLQIARRLGIAEGTVKGHLSAIFGKLNAVSRVDAINKYRASGPLTLDHELQA
jgi:DNA-binding NarL/FixJ family response regulator